MKLNDSPKSDFHIEFVDFLGEIRNDTLINGKAFIFKVLDTDLKETFESILFVHETVKPFITMENEEYKEYSEELMEMIFKKYKLVELLKYVKE